MAYDEGDDYPQGQNNFGLADNPLMPMGDPLAYAKVGAAPQANVPSIHTQGMPLQKIAMPNPVQPPQIVSPHGGGDPGTQTNQLQPSGDDSSGGLLGGGGDVFQNLLKLKGMEDLAKSVPTQTQEMTPGGAPVAVGAGAGPGRVPSGAVIDKAAAPYKDMVNDAAKQNGVDPGTLTRLLYRESQFNPKALSPAGAKGIGQFMDATAKDEGVNVNDPKSSIYGAAKYLAKMKNTVANGNDQLAMAAYNWGPGNVQKWLKSGADINNVPKETRDYVSAISGRPLAPNMKPNVPAANAAPMAAETTGNGGFAVPGSSLSPLVQEFNRPPNQREDVTPGASPVVQEFNKPPRGAPNAKNPLPSGDVVPPALTSPTAPAETASAPASAGTPAWMPPGVASQVPNMGNNLDMQKLWKYMLIKSLFPQIKFRNIGYDPWAVHRFGQGGGY